MLKIKDLFRPRPWFPEIRRIGSKMAGSDGGANNLVQDFEESFQVGDVVFVHPNNLGQNFLLAVAIIKCAGSHFCRNLNRTSVY